MSGNVQTAVTVDVSVTLDFNHVLSKLTLFIYLQEYCKRLSQKKSRNQSEQLVFNG